MYQTFLEKLRDQSVQRAREVFRTYDNVGILYFSTALAGETSELGELVLMQALSNKVGSLCNLTKKLERQKAGGPDVGNSIAVTQITKQKMAEEIGGVAIYLDLVAAKYGINLEDAIRDTFNAVSDKLNAPHRL